MIDFVGFAQFVFESGARFGRVVTGVVGTVERIGDGVILHVDVLGVVAEQSLPLGGEPLEGRPGVRIVQPARSYNGVTENGLNT